MHNIFPTRPYAQANLIRNILISRQSFMMFLRYLFVFVLVIFAFSRVRFTVYSLLGQNIYKKDFMQEYLLAKATMAGIDPYSPFEDLARQFLGSLPTMIFPHPIPHPPPDAVLSLPLAFLTYEQAAWTWYIVEILCIAYSAYMFLNWLGIKSKSGLTCLVVLLAFAWGPITEDLTWGQFGPLILVLLIGVWQAFRNNRSILTGILLGCAMAIKLIAWPIGLFFILRKQWRAVFSAASVMLLANFIAGLLMGFDQIIFYYTKVTVMITTLYRAHEANFSLWTIGWRLFSGTGSPNLSELSAPPLINSPVLARIFWVGFPLLVLSLGLYIANRVCSFDVAYAILIILSILLAPIVWTHYFVIALIPLLVLGRQLIEASLPKWETYAAILIGLLLTYPRQLITPWLILFRLSNEVQPLKVTFIVALITLAPTAALLGLGWLIWRMNTRYNQLRETIPGNQSRNPGQYDFFIRGYLKNICF